MAAVAVVVEIAVVAGGAAAPGVLAQDVAGGDLGLRAAAPAAVGLGGEGEARLEPLGGGVPGGVGAADQRRCRPGPGRRPARGPARAARRQRGELGVGGERREERVGEIAGEAGEAGLRRRAGGRRAPPRASPASMASAARLACSRPMPGCAATSASSMPRPPARSPACAVSSAARLASVMRGMAKRSASRARDRGAALGRGGNGGCRRRVRRAGQGGLGGPGGVAKPRRSGGEPERRNLPQGRHSSAPPAPAPSIGGIRRPGKPRPHGRARCAGRPRAAAGRGRVFIRVNLR